MEKSQIFHIVISTVGLILGIYIFAQGFLLTRSEISMNSTCSGVKGNTSCSPRFFKRVVILVVDALKFDFVDANIKYNESIYWAGNMKVIQKILKESNGRGYLSHFTADPPTTTLQRLKGLTTGGLPTFIDMSSNFGQPEIGEDNLIDQWRKSGWRVVFMGDDTWTGLFPNRFTRSYPYPSFNVKDLDSVDQGVRKSLRAELPQSDWDVIIAHFLGVDHCGHSYLQDHPEMRRKLTEMNTMLEEVLSRVDESTLVVLLGDHGMTSRGDHGGDSPAEVDAALFLYSQKGFPLSIHGQKRDGTWPSMAQIDLVPTLALLTGIPVPYSNLGVVQSQLFPNSDVAEVALLKNIEQVTTYIADYQKQFGEDLSTSDLVKELTEILSLKKHSKRRRVGDRPKQALTELRELFREKWTRFDEGRILQGLTLFAFSCVSLMLFEESSCRKAYFIVSVLSCAACSLPFPTFGNFTLGLCFIFFLTCLYRKMNLVKKLFLTKLDFISLLFSLILFVLVFSNSYVVNEDMVLNYLLQTLLLLKTIDCMVRLLFRSDFRNVFESEKHHWQHRQMIPLVLIGTYFVTSTVIAVSIHWRICREEQTSCQPSHLTQALSVFSDSMKSYKAWRYFSIVAIFVGCLYIHRSWLRHLGNLNGYSWSVMCINYMVPAVAVFVCLHWTIQCLPYNMQKNLSPVVKVFFPSFALFGCGAMCFILTKFPLTVFIPEECGSSITLPHSNSNWLSLVPQIVSRLKAKEEDLERETKVYGLASVFSVWHLSFLVSVAIILVVLLGDGFIFPVIFFFLAWIGCIFVNVFGFSQRLESVCSSWSIVVFAVLLGQYYFYTTGHQAALANIPWQADFIGWHGNHVMFYFTVVLILLNTFAGSILTVIGLPLLIPFSCPGPANPLAWTASIKCNGERTVTSWGEFVLVENEAYSEKYSQIVAKLLMRYFCLNVFMTLGTLCSAALHRRHLMVWKIFAPRMMFSVVGLGVTGITCLLTYLLSCRLHSKLVIWKRQLDKCEMTE